ncbi:MAG: hypothetical protein AB1522_16730 [Chloroflexota bacterium]
MRFKYVVLAAALMIAALFLLAASRDWLRFFFTCESFGCIGLGFLYLLISALIVASFFICGILFGPAPRLSSGLFAGGVATLAMAVSYGVLFLLNQLQIAQDWKQYEAACAQHPELCPEKSMP